MLKADETQHAGAHRDAIKAAFERHDVVLGAGAMLTPVMALRPRMALPARASDLLRSLKAELLEHLPGAGAELTITPRSFGGEAHREVSYEREIPLDDIDPRLRGVVARARESVLLGESGGHPAILEAVPNPRVTNDDVDSFVRSLLSHRAIDLGDARPSSGRPTHVVSVVRGTPTVTRVRFACRCGHV
jgi:hypothetical protein